VSPNQDVEHDNINQLVIQQNSLPPQDPVIDSVPEVIFMCFLVLMLHLSVAPGY
jgi:hypothetical protein